MFGIPWVVIFLAVVAGLLNIVTGLYFLQGPTPPTNQRLYRHLRPRLVLSWKGKYPPLEEDPLNDAELWPAMCRAAAIPIIFTGFATILGLLLVLQFKPDWRDSFGLFFIVFAISFIGQGIAWFLADQKRTEIDVDRIRNPRR